MDRSFSMGTWLVNVTGSLLLGCLLPFATLTDSAFMSPVTTGMLGDYTTFLTFNVGAVQLWKRFFLGVKLISA
ncbi:MAG: CrcB family protein [Novibacillus thermophilus]